MFLGSLPRRPSRAEAEMGHSGDGPGGALPRRGHCLDAHSEALAVRLTGRGVDEATEGIARHFHCHIHACVQALCSHAGKPDRETQNDQRELS